MTEPFVPRHLHFMLSANVAHPRQSVLVAKAFLLSIVAKVGMKPVTKPQAVYVADPGNEGLTGSINLATSHCAFHVWDNEGRLEFDLYSCKEFKPSDVIASVHEMFHIREGHYCFFDRDRLSSHTHDIWNTLDAGINSFTMNADGTIKYLEPFE